MIDLSASASREGTFSIEITELDSGIDLAPRGELDLATAPYLQDELTRAEVSHDRLSSTCAG